VRDGRISECDLLGNLRFSSDAVRRNLEQLQKEGIIAKKGGYCFIP
jgi:DeoR/GlpR family transcriptional regulator of sugar metabolism